MTRRGPTLVPGVGPLAFSQATMPVGLARAHAGLHRAPIVARALAPGVLMEFLLENWLWMALAALAVWVVLGLVFRLGKLFLKLAFVAAVAIAVVWALERLGG